MPKLKVKVTTARKPRTPRGAAPSQPEQATEQPATTEVAQKAKAPRGRRPATENVIPKVVKVKAIKCREFDEKAIRLASIIQGMIDATLAKFGKVIEIRGVSDRFQVILNEDAGVPCRASYKDEAEIAKILKLVKKVPTDFWPAKWTRFVEKLAAA